MSTDDINWRRWCESTETLLGTVNDEYCEPSSISVVMEELRRGNENAYIPKVVSIGPRYKGRRELLPMEEIKLRCMLSLLHRARETRKSLIECMKGLLDLDAAVRASYVEEIKLDRYELATIMLHDGCFLLEVLISESNLLNEQLRSNFPSTEGAEVGKIEAVLTDLTLLENQIPLFIIHELFSKIFGITSSDSNIHKRVAKTVVDMAVCLFGYPRGSTINDSPTLDLLDLHASAHILELAHLSFIKQSKKLQIEFEPKQENLQIEQARPGVQHRSELKQTLNRCATRLLAAGFKLRPIEIDNRQNIGSSFQSGIEFNKTTLVLHIPALYITPTTEIEWRNFIAWEHHIYNQNQSFIVQERHLKNRNNSSIAEDPCCCIFTLLAILFNDLICCANDVQLLKDIKVIQVDESLKKSMSNQDLKTFFRSTADGVNRLIIHSRYIQMFDSLNRCSETSWVTRFPVLLCHYIRRMAETIFNLGKFLRRGYNFAATLLTLLTVVQTIYTVLSYHYPK